MSVTVVLPAPLKVLARGETEVELEPRAATVGAVLSALRAELPAVYDRIVTEQGEIRPHINVFVGTEDIRWSGGLATPVPAGGEVVVIPSVSGG